MTAPVDQVGTAARITTVGASVQTYRVADATTFDTNANAFYAPDLFDISDMAGSIPDPLTPIASVTSCGITLANRAGRWYAALNAEVTFDFAVVEVWRTVNQEFDSSDDPYWRGTVDSESYDLDDDLFKLTARGPASSAHSSQPSAMHCAAARAALRGLPMRPF